jgi:hypothetical protein
MAGAINVVGTLSGLPQGSVNVALPPIIPSSSNLYAETTVVLASGANTVTVPTWAVGCIITPPTSNTVALTLKGVTGDTGILIGLNAPLMLSFPATPPTSFVITAASITTGDTSVAFF